VLGLLGAAAFFLAAGRRGREALGFSAVFFTFSMATFVWLPERQVPTVYAPNLLAILALGGLPQWARRWPQRVDLTSAGHASAIVVAGLMLWLFVSRWVVLKSGGAHFYLTASWAALALGLFGAGLGLRERLYRWLGLGLLGCALGRVVLSDVWRLATLYRILSFIALGLVLLVLGFIYNKYQDKIKDWL
jgi:uncharacterized membrane protein